MSDEQEPPKPRPWDLDQFKVGGTGQPPPDPFTRGRARDDDDVVVDAYDARRIRARYRDDGTLILVALKAAVLTVLTLGLYRFWMVTRLRRYYAGAIRIDGDPLEYTGTGLEKLLGFLLALVVLAVYLGLVNLGLTYVGLSYFQGNPLALQLSLLAVVPFYFWAAYRARRYVMSRLRWRGIRFGVAPGAWGYMFLSLGLSVLTIVTAGLALPYQHFKQAQYMTDRTWFGNLRFRQEGSWIGLLSYWIWLYLSAAAFALLAWTIVHEASYEETFTQGTIVTMMTLWMLLAFFLFYYYQIGSFRYLWDNRAVGEASLGNDVSARRVFVVYLGGYIMVGLCTAIAAAIILAAIAAVWIVLGGPSIETLTTDLAAAQTGEKADVIRQLTPLTPVLVLVVFGYLMIFAVSHALTQLFLIQPVLKRKVEAMMIENPQALRDASQRAHDEATEAGGFADALGVDVGAGI